jgi:hypothetical protein
MASSSNRIRLAGLAGGLAGAVLVPYALIKGQLTTQILTEGWHVGPLSSTQTALLVHVAEAIPLVVVGAGLLALDAHLGLSGRLRRAALGIGLAGIGVTVGFHIAEHVLPPVTLAALSGLDLLVWAYYLGWLVIFTGVAVLGVAILRARSGPTSLGAGFVALPVLAVGVGAALVALDWYTLAGTFRVALGVTWLGVGGWLWAARSPASPSRTDDVAVQRGPKEG